MTKKSASTLAAMVAALMVIASGAFGQTKPKTAKDPLEFVPAGYEVYERFKGDLNKDGLDDHVLMVRNTDAENILDCKTCYHKGEVSDREECMYCRNEELKLDRNPQGIIVAFKKGDHYELAMQNLSCFPVEPWQGGTYIPPEKPNVSIKRGNLFVEYGYRASGLMHVGKSYNFRYQNSDFELIGYDYTEYCGGDIGYVNSINFLSKKRLMRGESGCPWLGEGKRALKEAWENFTLKKPIRLSEIPDFDNLSIENMINK